MQRTEKDIGQVERKDGKPDQRFTHNQVLNQDNTRDMRVNPTQAEGMSKWHTLVTQDNPGAYNEAVGAPTGPGTYHIGTSEPGQPGQKEVDYEGKSINVQNRVNQHGHGGTANIADKIDEAQKDGKDVFYRSANTNSNLGARAEEKTELSKKDYPWNDKDNDGRKS
jgi:hypothetical protein